MAEILFPLRAEPDRAWIVAVEVLAAGRNSDFEIRLLKSYEASATPGAQKGRNSRTAYRFSTDHRSREYLLEIFRSLSLSSSVSLFFSLSFFFSPAGSLKGSPTSTATQLI